MSFTSTGSLRRAPPSGLPIQRSTSRGVELDQAVGAGLGLAHGLPLCVARSFDAGRHGASRHCGRTTPSAISSKATRSFWPMRRLLGRRAQHAADHAQPRILGELDQRHGVGRARLEGRQHRRVADHEAEERACARHAHPLRIANERQCGHSGRGWKRKRAQAAQRCMRSSPRRQPSQKGAVTSSGSGSGRDGAAALTASPSPGSGRWSARRRPRSPDTSSRRSPGSCSCRAPGARPRGSG